MKSNINLFGLLIASSVRLVLRAEREAEAVDVNFRTDENGAISFVEVCLVDGETLAEADAAGHPTHIAQNAADSQGGAFAGQPSPGAAVDADKSAAPLPGAYECPRCGQTTPHTHEDDSAKG